MPKRAKLPNVGEISTRDQLTGQTLQHIEDVFNNFIKQFPLSATGVTKAPSPVSQISVAAAAGIATVTLTDKNSGAAGLKYVVEYSTDPNFSSFGLVDLGESTVHKLALGAGSGTYYFRAAAKFLTSERSAWAYFGTESQPTGVVL